MEKFDKQNEIKIENIPQESLNNLLNDIEKYDEQHSFNTWLGKNLTEKFIKKFEFKYEGYNENNKPKNYKINKNLTLKDIYNKDNIILNKLGIDIQLSKNKELDDENEESVVGELCANLVDKNLYINFLKTLDTQNITKEIKKLLEILSKKFARQIRQEYSFDKVDNNFLELISGLKDIISEYERIGLSEKITDLKEYQKYMNSGYLKEYISAINHKIFQPIGSGFNLSTFQRDSSYEHYIKFWDKNFFDELENIEKNPKAKDFYNKVLKYGEDCIAFAEKDLETMKKRYNNPKYIEDMERAIKDTRKKIKIFE